MLTQQAWPHFVDQHYGRVVKTISTGAHPSRRKPPMSLQVFLRFIET